MQEGLLFCIDTRSCYQVCNCVTASTLTTNMCARESGGLEKNTAGGWKKKRNTAALLCLISHRLDKTLNPAKNTFADMPSCVANYHLLESFGKKKNHIANHIVAFVFLPASFV